MASGRRVEQVENLLREVVAGILLRDFPFPAGTMVTVPRATVSDDLFHATIYISILGENAAGERQTFEELTRSAGDIQFTLNRKLRMRPVPRITFAMDQDEKRRERIEKLLGEKGAE